MATRCASSHSAATRRQSDVLLLKTSVLEALYVRVQVDGRVHLGDLAARFQVTVVTRKVGGFVDADTMAARRIARLAMALI